MPAGDVFIDFGFHGAYWGRNGNFLKFVLTDCPACLGRADLYGPLAGDETGALACAAHTAARLCAPRGRRAAVAAPVCWKRSRRFVPGGASMIGAGVSAGDACAIRRRAGWCTRLRRVRTHTMKSEYIAGEICALVARRDKIATASMR